MSIKKAAISGVVAVAAERAITMSYGVTADTATQIVGAIPVVAAVYLTDMVAGGQSRMIKSAIAGGVTYGLQTAFSGDSSLLWVAIGAASFYVAATVSEGSKVRGTA
jgi:hypothetical protein